MATISDVAKRAGVSTATVSRTLNGKSTVDPSLARRVRDAAAELGYHPNGLARNLRRQETAVLALIIADVENPFFTAIARGVEDVARKAGYSVVLCNSDEDPDKEQGYIDVALQERVAGVVLSPTDGSAGIERLRQRGTPVVAVDRPLTECDQVLVDSRLAAQQATEHLLAAGYTRVGCVTGPTGVRTADDRLAGYRDALGERGPWLERRAEYRASGGREAARALLGEKPDALLVANSAMAIGVLEVLGEAKLRLGRDVGVIAFDDVPWATLIDPPLTVVKQPAGQIGTEAARLLLARINDPQRAPKAITLGAELIERGSTSRR